MINKRIPYLLLALGVMVPSLYTLLLRHGAPAFMHDDFVRGAFYGFCIGLEIAAVLIIKRRQNGGGPGCAST